LIIYRPGTSFSIERAGKQDIACWRLACFLVCLGIDENKDSKSGSLENAILFNQTNLIQSKCIKV
jgi:hypothetical protein